MEECESNYNQNLETKVDLARKNLKKSLKEGRKYEELMRFRELTWEVGGMISTDIMEENHCTSSEVLSGIVNDDLLRTESPELVGSAAEHINTSTEDLKKLYEYAKNSEDKDAYMILKGIAINSNTPSSIVEELSTHSHEMVRYCVMGNVGVSGNLLHKMWQAERERIESGYKYSHLNGERNFIEQLKINPKTPKETLVDIYSRIDVVMDGNPAKYNVKKDIEKHPNW